MTHMTRCFKRLSLYSALIGSLSYPALSFAQASDDDDLEVLEAVTVTGSYIPQSVDATSVPIERVSSADIEATGEMDLLDVIRKAVPQFVGNGNLGSANSSISGGSTNGGSKVTLRNVQTLVLVNGRRAAFSPVAATGGYDFVDVNTIPPSAVESIEILKDGASAIYGSDAVSGVVNIILKKDFQGMEVSGRYAFADTKTGTWEQRSASAVVGASMGDTSVTVAFDWLKSDPLFQNEKDYSFNQTGKTGSFAGIVNLFWVLPAENNAGTYRINEGQTAPLNTDSSAADLVAAGVYAKDGTPSFSSQFNLSQYVTLLLGNERASTTVALEHQVNDKIVLSGDLMYSQTETFLQLAAQPIVGMPFAADHVTDFGIGVGLTDPDHPQNPFDDYALVRNRFVDHPRQYYNDTYTLHGALQLEGEITEDISWIVGGNLNRVEQDYKNYNVINRIALANAIDAGIINLFNRVQAPGAFEDGDVFGVAFSKNVSTLNSFDARVFGEIPGILPGGPIGFAVGAETYRMTLSASPDAGSNTIVDLNNPLNGSPVLWDGATTTDPFDVARTVDSMFAEVRVPIIGPDMDIPGFHLLEFGAAVRQDRYSDSDDPTVPKFSILWQPFNDELVVRASYSESFSAPSLYSLFGPSGVGFSDQIINFEFYDKTNHPDEEDLDQAAARTLTSVPAFEQGYASSLLQPEESKSYNVGVVYSPRAIKGLSVELTYFRIEQTGITGVTSDNTILQDVELNGADSEYASRVRIGGFAGTPITAPGQIGASYEQYGSLAAIYITSYAENLAGASQDGIDFEVDYNFDIESVGRVELTFAGLWFNEFTVEGDDFVGTTNGQSVLNGGTIPRWRAFLAGSLQRGGFEFGGRVEYIPSVTDSFADPDETDPTADASVESFTRVDTYLDYAFSADSPILSLLDGLSLRVGVNNVFNEEPPMAASSWDDHNADTTTYGTLGRVVYMSARYKF